MNKKRYQIVYVKNRMKLLDKDAGRYIPDDIASKIINDILNANDIVSPYHSNLSYNCLGNKATDLIFKEATSISELKVIHWLRRNANPRQHYSICTTYKTIQKSAHVSSRSVSNAIKLLKKLLLLKKKDGVCYISPDLVMHGYKFYDSAMEYYNKV